MGAGERIAPAGAEASGPPERDYRLLVAYDGGRFHGWQLQPGLATVQGALEAALRAVTGQAVRVAGAGRTDAGVHALGQVASFRCATRVPVERLRPALNAHLPPDIRVLHAAQAPGGFHARFSALWRRYRYLLAREETPFLRGRAWTPRGFPELEPMRAAVTALLGEREFRGFTTQPEGPYGCHVREVLWDAWEAGWFFEIQSDRFLYQMVRIVVGTCVEIGRGRRPADTMARVLASGDRRVAGPLAPPHGLYLIGVGYEPAWPVRGPVPGPLPPGRAA